MKKTTIGAAAPPPESAPELVRVVVRDQPSFVLAMEKAQAKLPIEIVSVTIEELYDDYIRGDTPCDIMLALTDWLPELRDSGRLCPIRATPELAVRHGEGDFHPSLLSLCQWQEPSPLDQSPSSRHLAAVPFHVGPEVFHYRRDLFEDPAEQDAFRKRFGRELRPPTTWSEFVEVGQHFTRPGLWGCCFGAYPDGHNNVYDFLIHLWTRGGSLHKLDSPEAIEALTFYRDLVTTYQIASPECLELNSIQSGGYYAQGHVAMMWNWAGFATVAETSSIAGKNAITVIPRGDGPEGVHSSLNVFWALVKMSEGNELVERVFGELTNSLMDNLVGMTGNCSARRSTWSNPEMQQKFPYYAILEQAYNGARTLPAHPRWAEANHEISHAVERVMQKGEDVAIVLAECESRVRAILK